MPKIQQTQEDLEKHLAEQLHFLSASADSYDNGFEAEAKRMAVCLRILLHDNPKSGSVSLLEQLGIKSKTQFYDSAIPSRPGMLNMGASLVVIPAKNNAKAIPFLDDSPPGTSGMVAFDEFWHRPILYAGGRHFTREELVKAVTDQDGGAHVDPALNEEYANLSRNNSFGWTAGANGNPSDPIGIVELASIRQIAHEVLRTLVADYPHKKMPATNSPLVFPRIFFG